MTTMKIVNPIDRSGGRGRREDKKIEGRHYPGSLRVVGRKSMSSTIRKKKWPECQFYEGDFEI
ncbi:hypothetical protein K443DRAFT_685745 [Laccaria amethystina LaAM-08-1]|uniref:Uncharacterized protein n=1 Tax=Laccaria amethystina LaAM-08-1 TaxID=1095629 RepID=A0A0C9WN97_9AGAR|nr:hypothetical protein K443DRAFT_685745 [Laccaria amethystina LaAM-08-1]